MKFAPIPTTYSKVTFRSRLEADWAATLDSRKISWDYEPEGFQLSNGSRYLPDFYLPSARAWLEIKGRHNERVSKFEQFAADLWAESGASSTYDAAAPMVLIGRAPERPGPYEPQAYPTMTGVMGPGKAYSVIMSICPSCQEGTVVALWQSWCRNCGFDFGDHDALSVWMDNCDFFQPFVKVDRWTP